MRQLNYILVNICFLAFAIYCCNPQKSEFNEKMLPTDSLINEVILSALKLDSIALIKNQKDSILLYTFIIDSNTVIKKYDKDSTPFCIRIFPYVIDPRKVFDEPHIPGSYGEISMNQLYNSDKNKDNNEKVFFPIDTTFFQYQISSYEVKNVNKEYFNDIITRDYNSILRDTLQHFKVNLPLFSKDLNKVYIEIEHHFRGSWGRAIILKRSTNKWVKIKEWEIWTS